MPSCVCGPRSVPGRCGACKLCWRIRRRTRSFETGIPRCRRRAQTLGSPRPENPGPRIGPGPRGFSPPGRHPKIPAGGSAAGPEQGACRLPYGHSASNGPHPTAGIPGPCHRHASRRPSRPGSRTRPQLRKRGLPSCRAIRISSSSLSIIKSPTSRLARLSSFSSAGTFGSSVRRFSTAFEELIPPA